MTCSGDQKVTTMILKVDLDCSQCYGKIKRTLCRFPQIRNQVYDEKHNTVTITVVCCSPDRIMDKLCSKAGKSLRSIQIKPPPPPPKKPDMADAPNPNPNPNPKPAADPVKPPAPAPEPEKPQPKPKPAPAPQQPEKPKPAPAPQQPEKPKPAPQPQPPASSPPDDIKKNGSNNKPAEQPAKPAAAPPKPNEPAQSTEPVAQWVPGYPPGPPPQVFPVSVYYDGSYQQQQGGYHHYGRPTCPPAYYAATRCDYFSEDNPSACSIM